MIRVLIADDEPLARDGVEVMLRDDPQFEVVARCGDGLTALQQIRQLRPQIAFLDVQMPQLSGLDVYGQLALTERPAVVFVTAYSEHAVKAFEMSAVDYVVKPFTNDRFQTALTRACEQLLRGNFEEMERKADELRQRLQLLDGAITERTAANNRLTVKSGSEHVFINPNDILWIEVTDDLVNIRAAAHTYSVRMTLTALEQLLDSSTFVRVHRSFIVNRHRIKKVKTSLYGDYELIMDDERKIRMSRTYRERLKQLLTR